MITALKKVKGLGVFRDFTAPPGLPELKRFNIIYGENGSGKTTLSRLFRAIEDGSLSEYTDLQFTVATEAGDIGLGDKCARKLRVFNSDFVEASLGQFDTPIKHILIVGEENKALAEEIGVEQATLNERTQRVQTLTRDLEKLDKDKGKVFSGIATTIGEAISGTTQRRYRKPDAEKAYAAMTAFEVLPDEKLDVHKATVRQDQAEAVDEIVVPLVATDSPPKSENPVVLAANFSAVANGLTLRTAQSGALARLSQLPDVALWVEEGRVLHQRHGSDRCEYCDQVIPADRLKNLADHFSAEDQALKSDIEAVIDHATDVIAALESVMLPSKAELYSELRERFEAATKAFAERRNALIASLREISSGLAAKLGSRSTSYEFKVEVPSDAFSRALTDLNEIIKQHNKKTADFVKAKAAAEAAIVASFLSTIRADVQDYEKRIIEATAEVARLTNGHDSLADKRGMEALAESIRTKRAKISSEHAGAERMTQHLSDFLGRTELKFESDAEGYRVTRRGKPARRLSEGEKTAIAFLYFIVQLAEDFDVAEGVVVIDDPISSLDSSAIFQAFAYLKNAVKDAKQVFLLTHNFDFLKLLLNWLSYPKIRKQSTFLMLVCAEGQNGRDAEVKPLDDLLVQHPTEYHYLFKLLHLYKSDGTISTCYHMPNVARKVLETFLEFHVPSNGSTLEKLNDTKFDENKKTAIYKFTNDMSHHTGKGFDPSIVAETQKNTTYLLEMIKAVAPLHYEGLEKLAAA